MRFARLALLSVLSGTVACSLLLPYDDYDRAFGAADGSGSEAATEASDAPAPDVAPPSDAPADAGPSCVMPAPASCDADLATDIANCGACGHKCLKTNGACTVGVCDVDTAFSFWFVYPVGIALDDNYFYGVGPIGLGDVEGGAARGKKDNSGGNFLAMHSKDPRRLALSKDGNDLYWTQAGGIAHSPNNTLQDGAANETQILVSGQNNPTGIAVDADYVYWTNPPPDGDLWRASLKNPADAKALVAHADALNAYAVAVDAQYVYFTSYTQGGSVWRMDKDGGARTAIAQNQSYPSDVFVDGEALYWTNSSISEGAVMKLPKGSAAPLSLAGPRKQPGGVFARDPYVYFYETGATNKDVYRVDKCGGSPLRLAVSQKVVDLAVEQLNVYWTTGDAVNRVAR